ncbi:MAG: iron-containing alcohol dehydrogenase [Pirellulaceae bacterium]
MQFEFATATRIVFGAGTLPQAAAAAAEWGSRILLVATDACEGVASFTALLEARHLSVVRLRTTGEPSIESVAQGVQLARDARCDVVIGIGGGSVLDSGKAIAALLTNGGEPLDYLEVIGHGQSITQPAAPYVAIPTTAGTGAEVTRNAVLASPEHRVKVSLRSPLLLPRLALIDPELTYSLPPNITAWTGLDALTQVVEPFVSHANNPLTDALCLEGMRRAARSLRRAWEYGRDASAREDMALASLCGGLALANARLGAVHGLAGPLGGMFPAPHGATCAALLPHVMAVNIAVLQRRQSNSPALPRYTEVARILTGDSQAHAIEGAQWVQQLCRDLQIPDLRAYGVTEADFPRLIEDAARASSMQGNPIPLETDELAEILHLATP